MGKTFKKDAKRIVEAINKLDSDGLTQLEEALGASGCVFFTVDLLFLCKIK